jgi:hypothetical protein
LEKYQGALQTDGYEVYAVYDNQKGIETLGCWAHARSYHFFLIIKSYQKSNINNQPIINITLQNSF